MGRFLPENFGRRLRGPLHLVQARSVIQSQDGRGQGIADIVMDFPGERGPLIRQREVCAQAQISARAFSDLSRSRRITLDTAMSSPMRTNISNPNAGQSTLEMGRGSVPKKIATHAAKRVIAASRRRSSTVSPARTTNETTQTELSSPPVNRSPATIVMKSIATNTGPSGPPWRSDASNPTRRRHEA